MELLKHITAEDIERYGVVSAPDKLEGDPKENKMVFDRLVREMVAGAFNSAVDVINETMIATDEWGKEEAERVEAELARIAAEDLRVAAETERDTAETARADAETIREENERNRQSRETARGQAEESRADAEYNREAKEKTRQSQESARATAETSRATAESNRETKEQARQSQESTRQTNEQTRQDKEAERQRQEATRQANEKTRQTEEQSRASGESARGANEKARAAAEELRASAENSRAAAENLRASAETNRASAENLRAAAETDRASAEAGRKTAETSRATAESKRETAETNRASAETAREKAEQSRASAETSRINAENLRKSGEIDRTNAENLRVDAEEARVAAEKIREEAYQSRKVVQETGNSTTAVMSQVAVTNELRQLSNEKADQTYVRPEDYGAIGDGVNDDSAYIQEAIDSVGANGVVYLSAKYKISTGLVLSKKDYTTFRCDGEIVYDGTGAAITMSNTRRTNVDVNIIRAPNGTALKLDSTEGEVNSNIINVRYIKQSNIGVHLYTAGGTAGHNIFYNKFHLEGEVSGQEACVNIEPTTALINENFFWLGRLHGGDGKANGQYGIKINAVDTFGGVEVNGGAGRNVFFCGDMEGISTCGIYLHNTNGNVFRNFRFEEAYGTNSVIMSGECFANEIEMSMAILSEVDITGLTASNYNKYYNVIRSLKLKGDGFDNIHEVWISKDDGFTSERAKTIGAMTWETWTFTLADGSTIEKKVAVQ